MKYFKLRIRRKLRNQEGDDAKHGIEEHSDDEDGCVRNDSYSDFNYSVVPLHKDSLFSICAAKVLQSKRLTMEFQSRNSLSMRDLWQQVKLDSSGRQQQSSGPTIALTGYQGHDILPQLSSITGGPSPRVQASSAVTLILDGCTFLNNAHLAVLCGRRGSGPLLPSLRHVSLYQCRQVRDDGLRCLFRAYRGQLWTLRLASTGATAVSVQKMAKHCTGLGEVNLQFQSTVQDPQVGQLAARCKHITHLVLANLHMITDEAVGAIGRNLYSLRFLDLSWNPNIALGLSELAACIFLTGIKLQHCSKVDDTCLSPLISSNEYLAKINVRDCSSVTLQTIRNIAKHCENLEKLDIAGTSADGVEALNILGKSQHTRDSLREFLSSGRVVTNVNYYTWQLFCS